MRVLVAYASRHGATRGIAERVASTLEGAGLDVSLLPVKEVRQVEGYDACVIGAAAYFFRWLEEATRFVRRHRAELSSRPVWLFSSGPLGTAEVDAEGQDVRQSAEPREFAELAAVVQPRNLHVFFGAHDPAASPIGFMERLTRMMPAARDALPAGDFRDWDEIERWARGIARELMDAPVTAPVG